MATFPESSQLRESDVRTPAQLLRALNGFIQPVEAALRKGLTLRDNAACHLRTMEVAVPAEWVPITSLLNEWKQSPDKSRPLVAWRKRDDGMAEIQGALEGVRFGYSAFAISDVIWPASTESRPCVSPNPNSSYDIARNGQVIIYGTGLQVLQPVAYPCANSAPATWTKPLEIQLPVSFTGKPSYVLPVYAEDSKGAAIGPLSCHGWTQRLDTNTKQYTVTIPRVFGLLPLRTYRVTIAVLAG